MAETRPIADAIREVFGEASNQKVTQLIEAFERRGVVVIPKQLFDQLAAQREPLHSSP